MIKEFAVIGLGNFGATVARKLAEFKYKVTAVDSILADATEREFLENLNVRNFECVVVSTGEDTHASILMTLHLKELGARRIIVKAKSDDHARILTKLGADEAIIPEKEMAIRVAHSLTRPNLIDFLPLTEHYVVAEVKAPVKFVGKTLKTLKLGTKHHIQLIAAKDGSSGEFEFAPGGDYMVKQADLLFVLGKEADVEKLKG
jgi:trk system potassium uptake protein TrkA